METGHIDGRASCPNRVAKCLAQPASNTGPAEASGGYLLTCGERKEAKLKPIRCLLDQIFLPTYHIARMLILKFSSC